MIYGLLPIIENTICGLSAIVINADIFASADGMGMTAWQRMWQVELPLANSANLAGIRVSVMN